MLIHQTAEKLRQMKLHGMAELLLNQQSQTAAGELCFEERLGLLVDYEWTHRQNKRLARLLKKAKLKLEACLEDINYQHPRNLDQAVMAHLSSCQWLLTGQNVLISGPTGVGKTYIACALANMACRQGFSARYYRLSRLLMELNSCRADGSLPKFMNQLAKIDLLLIDDWGLAPLNSEESRDFLDIIDDRVSARSTIVAGQLPVEHWHELMHDPTVADAVLDRLFHHAHKLKLTGDSMRKT